MVSRVLTDNEVALARTIFGGSINYMRIIVTDEKYVFFQPRNIAMAPHGFLHMCNHYSPDYTRESPEKRALFIHEMTHVWQFQKKIFRPVREALKLCLKYKFNYAATYFYKLEANRNFRSYNMEQQAAILEDYFLDYRENHLHKGHCQNDCTNAERKQLYEGIIRGAFPKI